MFESGGCKVSFDFGSGEILFPPPPPPSIRAASRPLRRRGDSEEFR